MLKHSIVSGKKSIYYDKNLIFDQDSGVFK